MDEKTIAEEIAEEENIESAEEMTEDVDVKEEEKEEEEEIEDVNEDAYAIAFEALNAKIDLIAAQMQEAFENLAATIIKSGVATATVDDVDDAVEEILESLDDVEF